MRAPYRFPLSVGGKTMSVTRIFQGMPDGRFESGLKDRKRAFRARFNLGDTLEGVVSGLEEGEEPLCRVRVEGLELMAVTPFPVRTGQRLILRVEALSPEIVLRCMRVLGVERGLDMGGYYAMRRAYEKDGNPALLEELHALRLAFARRMSAPVTWRYFPALNLDGGRLCALEAAAWKEPGTALHRCLASGTLETGQKGPQRLFMEGLAKPPDGSWNLSTDKEYPALPASLRAAAENMLCECMGRCLPEPVAAWQCLSRKNAITGIAETGPALLARLG